MSKPVLPDKAVLEIGDDDLNDYTVIRVNDEITVDLMASACGIKYDEIKDEVEIGTIDGVPIPFASPAALIRMKQTYRGKDAADREYLERLLASRKKP